MSALQNIAKNTFKKVFANLSKELKEEIKNIQLGIYYEKGQQKFEVYQNFKKVKTIDIGDYVGTVIDWSGGTTLITATIAQSGINYVKEYQCSPEDIMVIMRHRENDFPEAVLLLNGKKQRQIDIATEYFQ